jgi:hypothetical protein
LPATKFGRRFFLASLIVVILLVGGKGASAGALASSGQAAATAAQAAPNIPATDASIQRWFKTIEKARIAFNDLLFRAEAQIASGSGTGDCSALVGAIDVVTRAFPTLRTISSAGAAIADAYGPPLAAFATAARACVNRDFAGARVQLGDTNSGAVAAYGTAQAVVDEILDGGA